MKERGIVEPATQRPDTRRRAIVPRLAAASREGWHAATAAWHTAPTTAELDRPAFTLPGPLAGLRRPRRLSPTVRHRLLAGLAIVLVLLIGCGALNISNGLSALAAARDAKAQVSVIQATLKGGGTTNAATLREVQTHLNALSSDLTRLQAAVPLQPVLTHTPGASGMVHLLRMAGDLVQAGQAAMPAAIILAPHLKEMLASLQSSSGAAPPATPTTPGAAQTPPPPPLTVASVQLAAAAINQALPFVQAGLAERAYVSDTDLRLIGLGKYLPLLHQLDAYLPSLPKVVTAVRAVTAALPTLLGVGQPTTFALFSLDSDELRPTGGFIGNYALLTLDSGKLTSGVHLQDIYSLDCPAGQFSCPTRPIPSRFSWMTTDPTQFGLRDSNLDPDYPASARLAEQMLGLDGAPAVQGVISITPHVIEQILQATGPVTIVSDCTMVTAQNLRDVIHYYPLAAPFGISSWCPGPQKAPSANRKAFDAELGSDLLHRVAILPSAQQSVLVKALLSDFASRDIQLYFNDAHLESALASFGMDGSVQSPPGDSLYVVDTNVGANYANNDVQEHVADSISVDARGTATHKLTLTYTYPKTSHIYSEVYDTEGLFWTYDDFVRVIVPQSAHFIGQDGCTPISSVEAGHAVWGCHILFSQPNTVTLHFQWSVPGAATTTGGTVHYQLLVQHEAGTRNAVNLTITGPGSTQLAQTPRAPLTATGTAQASYAATQAHDEALDVSFRP